MDIATCRRQCAWTASILGAVILAIALLFVPRRPSYGPKIMLWAWDVPENFGFLDVNRFGVAWLEMTIEFEHGHISFEERHQPVTFPKGIYLLPVIRLESHDSTFDNLSPVQLQAVSAKLAELAGPNGIQIDYDARKSERGKYAEMLRLLRLRLGNRPLTITALASWCIYDAWIDTLPVDAAVPMLFRMGAEQEWVRNYFNNGHPIHGSIASGELGLSTDEPIPNVSMKRQIFLFNSQPWTKVNLQMALDRIASRTNE